MRLIKSNPLGKYLLTVSLMIFTFLQVGACSSADTPETPRAEAQTQANQVVDTGLPDAPDFALENLDGELVRLSDYKGQVVFVNFWATWCPPCRAEIPYFIDLVNQYGEDGFVVLGIGVDPRDFEKVPGFVANSGINYPVLYANGKVVAEYGGIQSIPTTFVVNRAGKVTERIVGSRPKEVFEQIVKDLL